MTDNTHTATPHFYPQPVTRGTLLFALSGLLLLSTAGPITANDNNPAVVPVNAKFGGLSYEEWNVKSWQWLLALPAIGHPALPGNQGNIAEGQSGPVWFLVDLLVGPPVLDLFYTIPSGKAVFVPLYNTFVDNTFFPCPAPPTDYSIEQLQASVRALIDDGVTSVEVEIDGVPIKDPTQYRAPSEPFFASIPQDNLFTLPAAGACTLAPGTYGPLVADGYLLIVKPLSVGEHTIHEAACLNSPSCPDGPNLQVTWHIKVVPGGTRR